MKEVNVNTAQIGYWQAFSSELRWAIFDPSNLNLYGRLVTRLAAKQQTGVEPLDRCIAVHDQSMTRLLNSARAIFIPPGIFKREGL